MTDPTPPTLVCRDCAENHDLARMAWRCERCGGLLDLDGPPARFPLDAIRSRPATMWRYREALPVPPDQHTWRRVTMGEGMTPLVPFDPARPELLAKLEYASPTLSFKDRGAVVLVGLALGLRARRVVVDSSGNAGSAVAAYAARAGLACDVFVPESTSARKAAQIEVHGATLRRVAGSREDAAAAAIEVADRAGTFYASHVFHPAFHHGTKTFAFEVWEQLHGRTPATVVLPVGNGTLVLGAHIGFAELVAAGVADRIPRIVAVQAAACAPIANAHAAGRADVPAVTREATIAEGIAIAAPARGTQILAAVQASGGTIVTVGEQAITEARADLAARGFWVEPTAAAPWAAVRSQPALAPPGDVVVVPLCGAGVQAG